MLRLWIDSDCYIKITLFLETGWYTYIHASTHRYFHVFTHSCIHNAYAYTTSIHIGLHQSLRVLFGRTFQIRSSLIIMSSDKFQQTSS